MILSKRVEMSVGPGLQQIVDRKKEDLLLRKKARPLAQLQADLPGALPVRDFIGALVKPGAVSLIAELKKASPSAGLLRPEYNVAAGAEAYARAGARALSVLTEENFFLGHLNHVAEAKRAVDLPVLRKDFIFDPYQVYEARLFGADAVLLIVALLEEERMRVLMELIHELGMTPLVEVHSEPELDVAVRSGARLIGINSRNLKDLSMDGTMFEKLVPRIPEGRIVIAESGIKTPADVEKLKNLNVSAMLVGESLLRQPDLEKAAKILADAGKGK